MDPRSSGGGVASTSSSRIGETLQVSRASPDSLNFLGKPGRDGASLPHLISSGSATSREIPRRNLGLRFSSHTRVPPTPLGVHTCSRTRVHRSERSAGILARCAHKVRPGSRFFGRRKVSATNSEWISSSSRCTSARKFHRDGLLSQQEKLFNFSY